MATETAFRPHIDQENAQAVSIKGGNVSGKRLLSDKHLDLIFQPFNSSVVAKSVTAALRGTKLSAADSFLVG